MATAMTQASRVSYFFILAVIVIAGGLHLATPLVTVLFSYFALCRLNFTRHKWVSIALFLVLLSAVLYGLGFVLTQALKALPSIASESIPKIIAYARDHHIDLPFNDVEGLKAAVMDMMKDEFKFLGNFARSATKEFVFILIGVVVAVSMFLNPGFEKKGARLKQPSLFSSVADEIVRRFRLFYDSFEMVMGAQIIISGINTLLTAIFVLAISLKHGSVVIGLTFLCGMLPIIGNLISNSIIVGIAFTISPRTAIAALVFLVALHKFEYFLNSKIIGDRIENPVWLTLLALILGERLMGIPGMILAPVILNYIKVEAAKLPPAKNLPVTPDQTPASPDGGAKRSSVQGSAVLE